MVYLYQCRKCRQRFEMTQSIKDNPIDKCMLDGCDGEVHRVPQPVGVKFVGDGFHKNDYGKDSRIVKPVGKSRVEE